MHIGFGQNALSSGMRPCRMLRSFFLAIHLPYAFYEKAL